MAKVRPEDVEELIRRFQASDCTELHVRFDGFELYLSSEAGAAAPAVRLASRAAPETAAKAPPAPAGPAPAAAGETPAAGLHVIAAPYLGTFYRAPKPGEPSFVELGGRVAPGQDLCLVEVMKLFTAVKSDAAGTVKQVLARDGEMVEAGQPLFTLQLEG